MKHFSFRSTAQRSSNEKYGTDTASVCTLQRAVRAAARATLSDRKLAGKI